MNREEIRVYLDETHHLKDNPSPMVLGALWGSTDAIKAFSRKIKVLRAKHGIPTNRELKWTKVSQAKLQYYREILDLFLDADGVNYRAIIIDKGLINNELFAQTDDDFYYKMQYLVIRNIAERHIANFRLFFDYKDTWSSHRCSRIVDFLEVARSSSNNKNTLWDVFTAQPLRSHEVIPLQVADFLNGLVAFACSEQGRRSSKAKRKLVDDMKQKANVNFSESSPYSMDKINLLIWQPKGQE